MLAGESPSRARFWAGSFDRIYIPGGNVLYNGEVGLPHQGKPHLLCGGKWGSTTSVTRNQPWKLRRASASWVGKPCWSKPTWGSSRISSACLRQSNRNSVGWITTSITLLLVITA